MRDEIKAQRLADMFGMAVPDNLKLPQKVDEAVLFKAQQAGREAESVLAYVEDSRKFIQKECKNCGGVFVVNRRDVAYCCDHCRIAALEKIGIVWDPTKNPEERWDFREPLVVPPQVLEHLQPIVDHIEGQRELLAEAAQEQRHLETQNSLDELLAGLDLE